MKLQNDNKILLTIVSIATFLVAILGATFAYFSASDETDTQSITTANSSVNLTASNNLIADIKPTTFNYETVSTNIDVIKININANISSSSVGNLFITMTQPDIIINNIEGDSGKVSDIKYTIYNGDTQILAPTSFEATNGTREIISDTYSENDTKSYSMYVWIENNNQNQNNLQNISFKIKFNANTNISN